MAHLVIPAIVLSVVQLEIEDIRCLLNLPADAWQKLALIILKASLKASKLHWV